MTRHFGMDVCVGGSNLPDNYTDLTIKVIVAQYHDGLKLPELNTILL